MRTLPFLLLSTPPATTWRHDGRIQVTYDFRADGSVSDIQLTQP